MNLNNYHVIIPSRFIDAYFDDYIRAVKFAFFFGGETAYLYCNGILKEIISD